MYQNKKLILAMVILLTMTLLAGCFGGGSSDGDSDDGDKINSYTVKGVVNFGDEPVEGASIVATGAKLNEDITTSTDVDGKFSFTGLLAEVTIDVTNDSNSKQITVIGADDNLIIDLKPKWQVVGTAGFSDGEVADTNIMLDSNDTPYVVCSDSDNGTSYLKYNNDNNSWDLFASTDPYSLTDFNLDMEVGNNDIPYVLSQGAIQKYDGSNWQTIVGIVPNNSIDLALDSNDTSYIIYKDADNNNKATVKKYNESSWEQIGTEGFSDGEITSAKIVVDSNDTPCVPYVMYLDSSSSSQEGVYGVVVQKYDEGRWQILGDSVLTTREKIDIALDSNDIPYVIYLDGEGVATEEIMKYNEEGDAWKEVGTFEFLNNSSVDDWDVAVRTVRSLDLAFDSKDTPYVVYSDEFQDIIDHQNTVVQKYDGSSWEIVGEAIFDDFRYATYTKMAFDSNDRPYVVYKDGKKDGKAAVMTFK